MAKANPTEAGAPDTSLTTTGSNELSMEALMGNMEDDVALGQAFDADQMIIPRLLLLQDLSPQIKETKAEYMEGAKPGLFCLPLFNGLSKTVDFVPSRFAVRYLAWKPRKEGGGLVASDLSLEDVQSNFTQVGPGSWIGKLSPRPGEDAVNVEVIETPEWIGFARGANWPWVPCAISFPKTKAKVAKAMNTTISMTKVEGKGGSKFTPPSFYHMFTMTPALENSGDDEWFTPKVERKGWVTDTELLKDARQLSISAMRGEVIADDTAGV